MSIIDNVIDNAIDAFRFKDTIFYKKDSDLQSKYDALTKLNNEYPNNEELLEELYVVKEGLVGEKELFDELSKANMGMYVLRDVKVKFEDLTAQIDYVIYTPVHAYYVECSNLVGNITVNKKGDFTRELTIDGKNIKKEIDSPLREVEEQREVVRKKMESNAGMFKFFFAPEMFNKHNRALVVAANHDTVLDTKDAPSDMKNVVLGFDSLVSQLQYDLDHRNMDMPLDDEYALKEQAQSFLKDCINEEIDYYDYYKNKYKLS